MFVFWEEGQQLADFWKLNHFEHFAEMPRKQSKRNNYLKNEQIYMKL